MLAHFVIERRELLAVAAPRRVKLHEHVRVAIRDVRFDVVVDQVLHDGLGLDILNTNHDVNQINCPYAIRELNRRTVPSCELSHWTVGDAPRKPAYLGAGACGIPVGLSYHSL